MLNLEFVEKFIQRTNPYAKVKKIQYTPYMMAVTLTDNTKVLLDTLLLEAYYRAETSNA